jgi:hypothetical protein
MRHFVTLVAAAAFLLPSLPVSAEKPLPPAFGKELVPDEMTSERNESKEGEIEELRDKEEQLQQEGERAGHRGARAGGKVHIHLDGDEDGDDGDDPGDF